MQKLDPPATDASRPAPLARRLWRLLPAMGVVLLLVGIGVLFGRIRSESERIQAGNASAIQKERPAVNVVTLALSPGTIEDRLDLPGIVKPFVELRLLSEVRGRVTARHLPEGAFAPKGALLVTLDDRDYALQMKAAEASLKAASASLARIETLYREKLATRSQLDELIAQADNWRASRDTARLALERCRIRTPMACLVNEYLAEVGQFLNPGDPVAVLLEMDRVKVTVGIPESDVDAVRSLDTFEAAIDALSGARFVGTRHRLSKTADPMARLYELEIALDNPDHRILPDMFARIHIVKKSVPDAVSVPLFAVITRGDSHFVYVEKDGTAYEKKVRLGILDGWRVGVTEGLFPGERLIVVGHRTLSDQTPVKVVRSLSRIEELEE